VVLFQLKSAFGAVLAACPATQIGTQIGAAEDHLVSNSFPLIAGGHGGSNDQTGRAHQPVSGNGNYRHRFYTAEARGKPLGPDYDRCGEQGGSLTALPQTCSANVSVAIGNRTTTAK